MESEEDDQIASPDDYDSEVGSPAADDDASEDWSRSRSAPDVMTDAADAAAVESWADNPESPRPGSTDEDGESEGRAYQRGPHTPSDHGGETFDTPESPSENSAGGSDDGQSNQSSEEDGGGVEAVSPEQVHLGESPQSPTAASEEEHGYILEDEPDEPDKDAEKMQAGDRLESWKRTEKYAKDREDSEDFESYEEMRGKSSDEEAGHNEEIARGESIEDSGWTRRESDDPDPAAESQRTTPSPESIGSPCQATDNAKTEDYEMLEHPDTEEEESGQETGPSLHRPPSPIGMPGSGLDNRPTIAELAEQTEAVSLEGARDWTSEKQLETKEASQSPQSVDESQGRVDQSMEGDDARSSGSHSETLKEDFDEPLERNRQIADETTSGKNGVDVSNGDGSVDTDNELTTGRGGALETGKEKTSNATMTRSELHSKESPNRTADLDEDEMSDQSKTPDQPTEKASHPQTASSPVDLISEKAATPGASQSEMLDVHHLDDHAVELDYEEDVEDHDKMGKEGKEDGVEDGLIDAEEGEEDDEGELEDDEDMEEGEVKEPGSRKPYIKKVCRFYNEGKCTWGSNCRFVHPGINDKGNYSLIDRRELHEATAKLLGIPQAPPASAPARSFSPPPPPPSEPAAESAWERGLRHAKEIRKKALMRKEQDHNFEEKRMLGGIPFDEERDFDKENDFTLPQGNANFEEFYGFNVAEDESPSVESREVPYQQRFEVYNAQYERREAPQQYDYRRSAGKERQWQEEREEMERRDLARQRQREINRMRDRPRDIMRDRRTPPPRPLSRERPPPGNSRPLREELERPAPGRDDRRPKEMRGPPPPPGRPNRPADAWQDPWARSRSPKLNVKTTGRRRRSYSYSSDSFSDSSFSYRSRSRSRSHSSYSSSSSSSSGSSFSHSSFSRSRSRSGSRSRSPGPRGRQQPDGRPRQAFGGARQPVERTTGFPAGRGNQQAGRGNQQPGKAGPVSGIGRGATTNPGIRGGATNKMSSVKGPASDVGQQSLPKRPPLTAPLKPAPQSKPSSAPKQLPQPKGAPELPRRTHQDLPRSHHVPPMQQKKPGTVAPTDRRTTGPRKSPEPKKMPPGRQIRPRHRSSSGSSFTSHSSHSSYSSISRSRSRSVSSVSSYSSISSSESDMSPRRPSAMKGIDGKRLPPNTKLPKVSIPALQPRPSKAPTAPPGNRSSKPPTASQPKPAKPPASAKAPPSSRPQSSKPPSKPPPQTAKPATSSSKAAAGSRPTTGSKPTTSSKPAASNKPAVSNKPAAAASKPTVVTRPPSSSRPSTSRAPNGRQSPSRSSRAAPPSKASHPPSKAPPPSQSKQKSAPKPTAPSRDREKEKSRVSSGTVPSGPSAPSTTSSAPPRQHSTSAPVAAAPRSNTLKVTAHKDIKLTLLHKPSADPKKRAADQPSNQPAKKSSAPHSQAKSSIDKDRSKTSSRPSTASSAGPRKPAGSSEAGRKAATTAYPGKAAAPKPVGGSGDRKRPPSPTPPKGQPPAKVPSRPQSSGASSVPAPSAKPAPTAPAASKAAVAPKAAGGTAATKKSTTVSRREELLKQLRAVEDAIARKKAKLK